MAGMGHLGLRRLRWRSSCLQLSHRSPQTMWRLQPIQRFPLLPALGPYSRPCFPLLPMTQSGQGQQQRPGDVLGLGAYPDDPGADVGRGADDGDVVDQGPGADDAAAVG
jgi:hypothetical protein